MITTSNITFEGNLTSGVIFVPQHGNISDGFIRGLFKTYFLATLLLVAFIGNNCCRQVVKLNLLRNKTVRMTDTTGWIQGLGLFRVIWELRCVPGGWLGFLMILATALDLVGEYGVLVTVRLRSQQSKIVRQQGMIMNDSNANVNPRPNVAWGAYRWASVAQSNSFTNARESGLDEPRYGIYRIVTNDTNFMAAPYDIIGNWNCTRTTPLAGINYTQPLDGPHISDDDIWTDLYNRNLLFGAGKYAATSNISITAANGSVSGPSTHLAILTASNYTRGAIFEIATAFDTMDYDDRGSKQMHTWYCFLKAEDKEQTVFRITENIIIDSTLYSWTSNIAGAMFPDLRGSSSVSLPDIQLNLQWFLNSMIMVAGSGESLTTPNTSDIPIGIVQLATVIPYWVIAVTASVMALTLFLIAYYTFLSVALKKAQVLYDESNKMGHKVQSSEIMEDTPVGMLEWMTHAAYESRDAQEMPETWQLRKWIVSTSWNAGRRLGIVMAADYSDIDSPLPPKVPKKDKV